MMRAQGLSRKRGVALIMVLGIVVLMTVIISSYAFDMQVEARVLSYQKKKMQASSLARAGVERARLLLIKSGELKNELKGLDDASEHEDVGAPWFVDARELAESTTLQSVTSPLGDGQIVLSVIPEEARRNVNRLTEDDWIRIFEITAVPEAEWETLIASYQDWIDSDEVETTGGAETSYYEDLESPYKAKNAALDTVDELLLVRGFTRDLLYGLPPASEEEALDWVEPLIPMHELLTVYGDPQGRVNVNAASVEVLMTLPGVDDLVAEEIVAEREGTFLEELEGAQLEEDTSFESVEDFNERFPEVGSEAQGMITTSASLYRILSRGEKGNVSHTISCIISFSDGVVEILRWSESDVL